MEQRTMGIVLNYYRKKYNISQEEVCDGICSVTTFFRLEQGHREINSLIAEALLGRIGKEVTLFETMLNEEDYALWKSRNEIKILVEKGQPEEAEKLLHEYRNSMPQQEVVHEQFYLYQTALIMLERNQIAEMKETLKAAIELTIPDFENMIHQKRLYNQAEIEIILRLIHYQYFDVTITENILLGILEHINKYFEESPKEEIGTQIYMEMIESMHEYPNKVLEYATKGIQFIGQGKGYWHLGDLYFIKAKAEEQCNHQKQSIQDCVLAYHLFEIEENEEKQKEVSKFCEEKLQCQITEQEISLD